MAISIKTSDTQVSTRVSKPKPFKTPELAVTSRVIKGDTFLVMADAAKELEDEFVNLYFVGGSVGNTLAILPPFLPKTLKQLVKQNNILNQCVQAMEVNIDGTGHEFVKFDEKTEINPEELAQAQAFFSEPYPGKSFVSQRRLLRQDLESMGYGYIEVLRTMAGDIVGTRYIEGQTLRLVRLSEPVDLPYTMSRGGKDITLTIKERPRRYMQTFNGTSRQYFKEFGTPLDLDKTSGEWAKPGEKFPAERRASELLAFGVDRDYSGPYYLPRWINQLPSVIGSRKAEETNLEFFDSGGMPPAIIFIQGGQMVGDAANQLRTYLSNGNRKKGRAVVVELMSNGGTLNTAGTVTARVERFGAERMGDGMYDKYDTKTEEHVRIGFRLPHMFVGRQENMNYATAVVAYQVAEAQVFQPERTEFDEIINKTLMKEFGYKTIKFKSLPITMKSVDEFLKGMPLLATMVEGEGFVQAMNQALGTDLKYKEPPPPPAPPDPALQPKIDPHTNLPYEKPLPPGATLPDNKPKPEAPQANIDPHTNLPYTKPVDPLAALALANQKDAPAEDPAKESKPVKKTEVSTLALLKLVRRTAEIEGLVEPLLDLSDTEKLVIKSDVKALDDQQRQQFDQLLTAYVRPVHDHH